MLSLNSVRSTCSRSRAADGGVFVLEPKLPESGLNVSPFVRRPRHWASGSAPSGWFRQAGGGVDAFAVAVANDCVERGGTLSALCIAHEQPDLLADGAREDRVRDKVVAGLHEAVTQEHAELCPLGEGAGAGFSREAALAAFEAGLQGFERAFDALEDGQAVPLTGLQPFGGSGTDIPQSSFDLVELLGLR